MGFLSSSSRRPPDFVRLDAVLARARPPVLVDSTATCGHTPWTADLGPASGGWVELMSPTQHGTTPREGVAATKTSGLDPNAGFEHLLDAGLVAELLRVPKSWVYAEARAGRLPHVQIGRYRRFRLKAIEEWIEARERGPVGS